MSKIGNLVLEMQDLIIEGFTDVEIANTLSIPVEWVTLEREEMESEHGLC